jgi:hypothetical protein
MQLSILRIRYSDTSTELPVLEHFLFPIEMWIKHAVELKNEANGEG